METVNRRVILIAVIMALFTTFLIYIYIKKATTKPDVEEYINVYVASKTMPAKHLLSDSDLKQVRVTKDNYNPNAVLNKGDIVGKRLKDRVIEGEQVLRDRLVNEENFTLAFKVPKGMRAVSVNVNEQIEVANLIMPGDYVDIIASFEKEDIEDRTNKTVIPRISKIILQNIQVLALGQQMEAEETQSKELPKTVTLAVSPQEAERLVYATEYGIIRMALRAVEDKANISTNGIIRNDLASGKGTLVLPK